MTAITLFDGLRGELRYGEPLAKHTVWRVGGPANRWYRPADSLDLCGFLRQLPRHEPLFWLGLGSRLLVRDGGLRGTVVATSGALEAMNLQGDGTVRLEAGVPCSRGARFCARHGLSGAEFLIDMPGTIGGLLAMEADDSDAVGDARLWDWVTAVETVDRQGQIRLREAEHYRRTGHGASDTIRNEWFCAAYLWLQPDSTEQIERRLRERVMRRSLMQSVGAAVGGSVFHDPPNDFAGRLIAASGLQGFAIGGACLSSQNNNVLINSGQATAADLEVLIEWVAATVATRQGIRLRPRVQIIGEQQQQLAEAIGA